jgi:hypothetical protein
MELVMYKYQLWVKINEYQTVNTVVYAENDYAAKLLGESQYGTGNVLNYTRLPDPPQENSNW